MSFAARFLGDPGPMGFGPDAINRFIKLEIEEGINLDYKNIAAIDDPDKLAIAITALANASGGLLVLGVEEERDKDEKGNDVKIRPGKITWGPPSLTREKVESVLVARVQPWVEGLRIYPIRRDDNAVVFLLDVPQSVSPPHMAPDKRYYLRYNFMNLQMHHYQVQALFLRRLRPKLHPSIAVINVEADGLKAELRLGLENHGGASAKQPLFFGRFWGCSNVKDTSLKFFFSIEPDKEEREFRVYSQSPMQAVHPRMITYVGNVHVELEGDLIAELTVGAEEMPTKDYWIAVSPKFLRSLAASAPKKRHELFVVSVDEPLGPDDAERFLLQSGIDLQELAASLVGVNLQDREAVAQVLLKFFGK